MEYAISPIWIGIDLGGTSLRVGLYGPEMQLLDRRSMRTRLNWAPMKLWLTWRMQFT